VEKHTKRDAAIGGAAGAIIGAATSKDKVKGAVIGGAAGAILGGVIGNNVDKKTTTKP
jgi:outer membrane lipoprotein SlyB